MAIASDWENARRAAEAFLSRSSSRRRRQPRSWPVADRLGGPSAVYWWDDQTPLFEVPLYANDAPAGYVIASGTYELPPILEASPMGIPASQRLTADITSYLVQSDRYPSAIRWQYWSALEVVAEVTLADGAVIHVRYPEMHEVTIPTRLSIHRTPSQYWHVGENESRWHQWLDAEAAAKEASIGIILESREPVYYNQNCRTTERTEVEPPTYCSPNCIAGCVPVALAMLASSWKKVEVSGSQSRIWPSTSCWSTAWPSATTPDPNQCAAVNQTIWDFHDRIRTTCGGGTIGNQVAAPTTSYYRSVWGLPWTYQYQHPASYDQCTTIIERRHPFVFMAVGQWSAYLQQVAPDLTPPIALGEVGHAVLCWGFDAAPWVGGPGLLVGLGWGSGWASRWIEYDQFSEPQALFVSAFS